MRRATAGSFGKRVFSSTRFIRAGNVVIIGGFVNCGQRQFVPPEDAFHLMFAAAGEVSGHVADVEILGRGGSGDVHQPPARVGARDRLCALHGRWVGCRGVRICVYHSESLSAPAWGGRADGCVHPDFQGEGEIGRGCGDVAGGQCGHIRADHQRNAYHHRRRFGGFYSSDLWIQKWANGADAEAAASDVSVCAAGLSGGDFHGNAQRARAFFRTGDRGGDAQRGDDRVGVFLAIGASAAGKTDFRARDRRRRRGCSPSRVPAPAPLP